MLPESHSFVWLAHLTGRDRGLKSGEYRFRNGMTAMGLALVASVVVAAFAGRLLGDLFGDSYDRRLAIYLALLLYVIVGAVVLIAAIWLLTR